MADWVQRAKSYSVKEKETRNAENMLGLRIIRGMNVTGSPDNELYEMERDLFGQAWGEDPRFVRAARVFKAKALEAGTVPIDLKAIKYVKKGFHNEIIERCELLELPPAGPVTVEAAHHTQKTAVMLCSRLMPGNTCLAYYIINPIWLRLLTPPFTVIGANEYKYSVIQQELELAVRTIHGTDDESTFS